MFRKPESFQRRAGDRVYFAERVSVYYDAAERRAAPAGVTRGGPGLPCRIASGAATRSNGGMSAFNLLAGLRDRLGTLGNLPRLLRLIWRTSPGLTLATVALRLLRALLPTAALYVGKLIIDAVVAEARLPHPGPALGDWIAAGRLTPIALLVLAEAGLGILSDLLGRASQLVGDLLGQRYSDGASLALMRHAATLDLEQFESADQQDRLDRARRQVTGRSSILQLVFGQAQDLVTVAALAAGFAAYAPWLLALLAAALVPAAYGELHFNREGYRLNFGRTPERRQVDYLRYLGASVETAKEVKLFGLEVFLAGRFAALSELMFGETRRLATRRALWGGLFATLSALSYYAGYAVILWRTLDGDVSIGDLGFLAGSLLRLRALLEGLLLGLSQLASQAAYLDDLFSFFDIVPAVRSPEHPRPFPTPIWSGIRFEGVGFRYPDAERWALRGLDLEIRTGEVVALVGENGAGKTTIVKLLSRLYDPVEGRITVDGIDLRAFALDDLRTRIALILQDFVRYSFTAAENIEVGLIAEAGNRPRVADAAARALADRVIERLPQGYAQPLGRRFKDGVELSGGEWQKMAIARAYMRDGAVLVLDEPTAALDARAEYEVFRRFRDLSLGRTCLIISHRFSTVRMADRIVVLEEGRVQEQGSHADLLERGGRYAALFELQAAGYR